MSKGQLPQGMCVLPFFASSFVHCSDDSHMGYEAELSAGQLSDTHDTQGNTCGNETQK